MAAVQPRIKLHFEGILREQLIEHNLEKCWYQLPLTKTASKLQTVADLTAKLHEAFDLLGEQSDFQVQLDGYAVLSNSPLTLFRDGDTVTITSKAQQQSLPLTRVAKPEGSKRKRPEAPLALTASEVQQNEVPRPKKRKKAAATTPTPAAASIGTAEATAAEDQVPDDAEQPDMTPVASKKKNVMKKRRKRSQSQDLEAGVAAIPGPQAGGDALDVGGDALDAAGNASSPDGDAFAPTEEKKQSRSARRKQLKRRYRREGAPAPPAPSSSSMPSGSVNAALTAAAEASPFDPNAGQPHQGILAPNASDSPSPKRLKTQSHAAELINPQPLKTRPFKTKLKAQHASEGHVYFAGSESDSGSDEQSLPPAPSQAHAMPSSSQQTSADPQGSDQAPDTNKGKGSHPMVIGTQTALKSTTAGAHAAADKDRAGPSLPFPASDDEYAALPAINGQPQQGDIVAYRILEIAANWAPEISEWRHGEVAEAEADLVVIKPTEGEGSQAQHPIAANSSAEELEEEEEEEEEEGPPSNYDEHGVLAVELTSFSQLRLIKASLRAGAPAKPSPIPTNAPACGNPAGSAIATHTASSVSAATAAETVSVPTLHNGQKSTAAKTGNAVPNIGAWTELNDQIARKRAELADRAASASAADTGSNKAAADGLHSQQQTVTPGAKPKNAVSVMLTPGAARPRGGVRASAMGPMLAFLRSSGGLAASDH